MYYFPYHNHKPTFAHPVFCFLLHSGEEAAWKHTWKTPCIQHLCLAGLAALHRSQMQYAHKQPVILFIQAAQCAVRLATSLCGKRGCRWLAENKTKLQGEWIIMILIKSLEEFFHFVAISHPPLPLIYKFGLRILSLSK